MRIQVNGVCPVMAWWPFQGCCCPHVHWAPLVPIRNKWEWNLTELGAALAAILSDVWWCGCMKRAKGYRCFIVSLLDPLSFLRFLGPSWMLLLTDSTSGHAAWILKSSFERLKRPTWKGINIDTENLIQLGSVPPQQTGHLEENETMAASFDPLHQLLPNSYNLQYKKGSKEWINNNSGQHSCHFLPALHLPSAIVHPGKQFVAWQPWRPRTSGSLVGIDEG